MMNRVEVLIGRLDAHLDPNVGGGIDIPGACMANHFAIARLREHRTFPECLGQRREPERGVEPLARFHHIDGSRLAALQNVGEIVTWIYIGRPDELIDVGPILGPDIAEKMRRNRSVCRNDVAIFVVQLHTHVGVELQIQRANLVPEPVDFLREGIRRHVVFRPPHGAAIGEAEFSRTFIG